MKEKKQAPHDEIKSYLKVAKERLDTAFFTRPEWRHPKTAAGVDVIISRINEVYYPFSDRKRPKSAVWRQVLREKREEMIGEIKAAKETEAQKKGIGIAEEKGITAKAPGAEKGIPRLEVGRELPANPPPDIIAKIALRLRATLKANRCGSKVARKIGITPATLICILAGRGYSNEKRGEWLRKIEEELSTLLHDTKKEIRIETQPAGMKCKYCGCTDDHACLGGCHWIAENVCSRCADDWKNEHNHKDVDRVFNDLPQPQASLISSLSAEIKGGQLHVHVVVDADTAFTMYKERQCSITNDEIKFSME